MGYHCGRQYMAVSDSLVLDGSKEGMARDEQVLVVERKVFDELGAFRGLQFDVERYLDRLFAAGTPRFLPRPQAERDPNHKQLIPYVLMTCEGRYLTYVRGNAHSPWNFGLAFLMGSHGDRIIDASLMFPVTKFATLLPKSGQPAESPAPAAAPAPATPM